MEQALYTPYIHCVIILEARMRLNFEPSLWLKLEATHLLYVFLLEMLIPRTVINCILCICSTRWYTHNL